MDTSPFRQPEAEPGFESSPAQKKWFKQQSLELLAQALGQTNYPGYPDQTDRLWFDGVFDPYRPVALPLGASETSSGARPSVPESEVLAKLGFELDIYSRPLHPWFFDMIEHPGIGVVTGKGFYWNWGPNYTADPIVIRHDLDEPHVLLIERSDGTGWALPGGFVDSGESSPDAALREASEETGIDIRAFRHNMQPVYKGPLADLRVTANAWPETTAFRIDLELSTRRDYIYLGEMMSCKHKEKIYQRIGRLALPKSYSKRSWQGSDDAKAARWVPISQIGQELFGSHKLLIELALETEANLSSGKDSFPEDEPRLL